MAPKSGTYTYKRKRSYRNEDYGMGRPGSQVYGRHDYKKKKKFVAGRDRTGGFYGRYIGRNAELKFFDTVLAASITGGGTIFNSINLIPQGVLQDTRVGRKCVLKSLHWHWTVDNPEANKAASPNAGDSLRLIMFLDKQCNGAGISVTDILKSATYSSHRNLSNRDRFTILCDKEVNLNYSGMASETSDTVTQARQVRSGTWYKKCNIPIEFSGTTGVIGEIRSNNIGLLAINITASADIGGIMRVRFSDM